MNRGQSLEPVLDQVSQLLDQQIGLRPEPSLRSRLRRCIRDDAASRGERPETYVNTLRGDKEALQGLFDRITVQETSFFRHPEQFDVLARELLPALPRPLTLWSAACANGQEAFSLAMLLEEHNIDGHVIASDLSRTAMRRTTLARYTRRELTGLSAERIDRHLSADGDEWLINRSVRDRVRTRQHNLLDPLPTEVTGSQVILCRNVLIYFTANHAAAFLHQVADAMPGATLFLGAAEAMWPLTDRYETIRIGDTFTYRPHSDAARRSNGALRSQLPPAHATQTPRPAITRPAIRTRPTRPVANPSSATAPDPDLLFKQLTEVGQLASAAGDIQSAIIAFRKCVYLAPLDPITHLHLGLMLETAGDHHAASRAFAASREVLLRSEPAHIDLATEGYTIADLLRLLDSKQQALIP